MKHEQRLIVLCRINNFCSDVIAIISRITVIKLQSHGSILLNQQPITFSRAEQPRGSFLPSPHLIAMLQTTHHYFTCRNVEKRKFPVSHVLNTLSPIDKKILGDIVGIFLRNSRETRKAGKQGRMEPPYKGEGVVQTRSTSPTSDVL